MQYLNCTEFLKTGTRVPVIDVRSPAEYLKGHITGAANLPLFNDEERADVGTTYTKLGKEEAIRRGLKIVGPKLSTLADTGRTLAEDKRVAIYCWRGGMRSEKMGWLLELMGLETFVLKGGYKQYRHALMKAFTQLDRLIVLQGATGSGKTDILHALTQLGEQVIDLEGHACHKGSAFGHIGMDLQPSSQQFQNDVYAGLLRLDAGERIWIESESLTIGKVYLPDTLWETMNKSTVIELVVPKNIRAARLVREYGQHDVDALARSIKKISDRFGGNRAKEALRHLESGNLHETALLLLDYYDKTYSHSRRKYKDPSLIHTVHTDTGSPEQNAVKLVEIASKMEL